MGPVIAAPPLEGELMHSTKGYEFLCKPNRSEDKKLLATMPIATKEVHLHTYRSNEEQLHLR